MIHRLIEILSSVPFSVKKVSEVDSDLSASDIIVCIAASIKTDQFKTLMKIKSDCICIAGLRLQNNSAPFLPESNLLCFIHQPLSDAFPSKRIAHPQLGNHEPV